MIVSISEPISGRTEGFLLGSAVEIEVITEKAPTSMSITIKNPSGIVVATGAMTKEIDTVYSYIYQSLITDYEGEYLATISIITSSYTLVAEETFVLNRQKFT